MLMQAQNTPLPERPMSTPLPAPEQAAAQQMGKSTRALPPEQTTMQQAPAQAQPPVLSTTSGSLGELPEWLTGILNDADKTQIANKQAASSPEQSGPEPS